MVTKSKRTAHGQRVVVTLNDTHQEGLVESIITGECALDVPRAVDGHIPLEGAVQDGLRHKGHRVDGQRHHTAPRGGRERQTL
eukprot:6452949-Prymnesium_polylepis.1